MFDPNISEKHTASLFSMTEFVQVDTAVTGNMSVMYEGLRALGHSQVQKW
jgi:hypothetical protein